MSFMQIAHSRHKRNGFDLIVAKFEDVLELTGWFPVVICIAMRIESIWLFKDSRINTRYS